jgi:predicted nucleic acid-binding protein
MFLVDTNVISEARKGPRSDAGVRAFFTTCAREEQRLFLASITVGELRRGISAIRHRGDQDQAQRLEGWLSEVLSLYASSVLSFDGEAAQVWGELRVPHPEHALDKQIAAIALLHDLTVVTRNTADFNGTGVKLLNPFQVAPR